jgi:phospholipid/cholesterol/gamma-HCH transport system ATP-binding protein
MSEYFIEFQDVYKSFGEKKVLQGVSFGVRRGETLAILGKSGTGKSVTLMHIVGLLKPDSGHVYIDGQDVTAMSEDELVAVRRKVSLIFQSGALFDSLTVGENVAFPLYESNFYRKKKLTEEEIWQQVREKLASVDLEEMIDLLPGELATGMKRRVAIARALAAEPQTILYDEPTTMVDPLAAKVICDLVRKLQKQMGITSIVVTHDIAFCARKVADVVAFLDEGQIRFFGPMNELYTAEDPMVKAFVHYDMVSFPQTPTLGETGG